MVVDSADFDGSFPRKVAKLVSTTIKENHKAWKEGKSTNLPRMVLVVMKINLLPSTVEPMSLERWVKRQARAGGANKKNITSFHFVSTVKDWGLKNLVDNVVGLAGLRGCVWTVGAQNASKSYPSSNCGGIRPPLMPLLGLPTIPATSARPTTISRP
jgi:hypothetical protein